MEAFPDKGCVLLKLTSTGSWWTRAHNRYIWPDRDPKQCAFTTRMHQQDESDGIAKYYKLLRKIMQVRQTKPVTLPDQRVFKMSSEHDDKVYSVVEPEDKLTFTIKSGTGPVLVTGVVLRIDDKPLKFVLNSEGIDDTANYSRRMCPECALFSGTRPPSKCSTGNCKYEIAFGMHGLKSIGIEF